METDEHQIRQLEATWHVATAVADIAAILELMDEDVAFLASGGPPERGGSAFEKAELECAAGIRREAR
jgi:ketosteroid isomerase-like protein